MGCEVCGIVTDGFCSLCFAVICSQKCEEKHADERLAQCDKFMVPVAREVPA